MEKEERSESPQPRVSFVVTGFGPFRGVSDNPTTHIVKRLVSFLEQKAVDDGAIVDGEYAQQQQDARTAQEEVETKRLRSRYAAIASSTTTLVLETAAAAVQTELGVLYDRIKKERGNVVVLHLGVNYKGKRFQLERCAYNEASFRIPDEHGYQPKKECIIVHGGGVSESGAQGGPGDEPVDGGGSDRLPLGHRLATTLDVQGLCRDMDAIGFGDCTVLSSDPGRFVCNYTYCLSLDRCDAINATAARCGNEDASEEVSCAQSIPPLRTLFVHVPPFSVEPEERQMEFVTELMAAIWERSRSEQKGKRDSA